MTSKPITHHHLDELSLDEDMNKIHPYINKYDVDDDDDDDDVEDDDGDMSSSNMEEGSTSRSRYSSEKDHVLNQLGGNDSKWVTGSKLLMLFILGFAAATSTIAIYFKNKAQQEESFNTRVRKSLFRSSEKAADNPFLIVTSHLLLFFYFASLSLSLSLSLFSTQSSRILPTKSFKFLR